MSPLDAAYNNTAAVADTARYIADWDGRSAYMYVSGSAGGRLTAPSLAHPALRGGLAISGIYDLAPVKETYLNTKLMLTDDEVARRSPARNLPAHHAQRP